MASMLDACRANQGLPAKLTAGSRVGYDLSKVGAGASRGFSGKKKLEAAPWSGTWPAPGSSLDLDFANDRGFVRGVGQGGVMDGITFTRASNATYVGEDGLLKGYTQGGNNLLSFPQDFDNAAWTKTTGTVVVSGAADPIGGNTAYQVQIPTTNVGLNQLLIRTISAGQSYTLTVYLKADAATTLVAGINGRTQSTNNFAFLLNVTDTWQRYSMTMTAATNDNGLFAVIAATNLSNSGVSGTISITSPTTVYAWGAQLELGTEATEYFPTNINMPRFDWASTEQVESVNKFNNTEAFDSAAWVKLNVTVTANADGVSDKIVATATNSNHNVQQPNTGPYVVGANVISVEAKADGYQWLRIRVIASGVDTGIRPAGTNANFDLVNGVVGVVGGSASNTATIEALADGYYKCTFIWHATGAGTMTFQYMLLDSNTTADFPSFTGDGVSGILLRKAQSVVGNFPDLPYQTVAQPTTNTPLRPTPTCNGLLIEEARTNRLLWCRDATQTQWVKTDITAAKDQTGIDGVSNAASSLTATADSGTCIQTITLASGSRTGSVYLKRITGTGTVQVSLDGTTWSTVDLSADEWRRIVLSGTVTNPVVGVRIATSGDAVAMDFGQVEDGAFATSPILTTEASATRALDQATAPSDGWFDRNKGTVSYSYTGLATTTQFLLWHISGPASGASISTQAHRLRVDSSSQLTYNIFTFANVTSVSLSSAPNAYSAFLPSNITVSFSGSKATRSANVIAEAEEPVSGVLPTNIDRISFTSTGPVSRFIKRVIYIPESLSIEEVRELRSAAT